MESLVLLAFLGLCALFIWQLSVDTAEESALDTILADCPAEPVSVTIVL